MSHSKPVQRTNAQENNDDDEIVEDHLEVDKPVPGQNFTCVSFISPEKVLKKKEEFTFYHYYKCKMNEHINRLKSNMEALVKKVEDNKVKLSDVIHLKKNMDKGFNMDLPTFEDWKEKYEDFMFSKSQEIGAIFDKANQFQTSIRGVKVRGTYDTYREAEIRAKVLQKIDPLFDVFVGQVGYWLAWSPDTNLMDNQEHANEDLNELMKSKKDNAAQRDMFYEERKREMKEAAAKENADQKLKNKQIEEETQKIVEKALNNNPKESEQPDDVELNKLLEKHPENLNNKDEQDNTENLSHTVDSLQETDPWLARQNSGAN
jgi:hypothetical protein